MTASSAELEREATAAREKLAATLDALRENLAPGRLIDEIVGRVGGPKSVPLFRKVEDGIRSYPLPSMLLGVGSALFMGKSWTRKPAPPRGDTNGAESLKFADLDQKSMRDNVASVGHSVADTAYQTIRLRAAEKIEDMTKAATAGIGAASDRLLGMTDEMLNRTIGKVSAKVEERPMIFSVVALAVGAAVGAALLRNSDGKI